MLQFVEADPPDILLSAVFSRQLIQTPFQGLPKLKIRLVERQNILVFNGFDKPVTHLQLYAEKTARRVLLYDASISDERN